MTTKLRTYIAGPMRGIPEYNFPAFDAAEQMLLELGSFMPVSPASMDRQLGFDETDPKATVDIRECMKRDLAEICHADAIAFLPGWELSSGAKAERALGLCLGLRFFQVNPDNGTIWEEEYDV